ncbi:hypothetical protein [Oceanospirillum beijerinckii]|uniref:hypothetical protein n=1 Tax=Oceanospirillum beijerinckii TaxID=64976 RepID=UPI00048613AD|nr:hypothetical protein [Oceanospirillum beijerinckii]
MKTKQVFISDSSKDLLLNNKKHTLPLYKIKTIKKSDSQLSKELSLTISGIFSSLSPCIYDIHLEFPPYSFYIAPFAPYGAQPKSHNNPSGLLSTICLDDILSDAERDLLFSADSIYVIFKAQQNPDTRKYISIEKILIESCY